MRPGYEDSLFQSVAKADWEGLRRDPSQYATAGGFIRSTIPHELSHY